MTDGPVTDNYRVIIRTAKHKSDPTDYLPNVEEKEIAVTNFTGGTTQVTRHVGTIDDLAEFVRNCPYDVVIGRAEDYEGIEFEVTVYNGYLE